MMAIITCLFRSCMPAGAMILLFALPGGQAQARVEGDRSTIWMDPCRDVPEGTSWRGTASPTVPLRSSGLVPEAGGHEGGNIKPLEPAPVNGEPILADLESAPLAYIEDQGPVALTATMTVSDPDSVSLTRAMVCIQDYNPYFGDSLSFTDTKGITGTMDFIGGTVLLEGVATLDDYQAALRTVTFATGRQYTPTPDRCVIFAVFDGTTWSAGVSRTVTVSPINEAPRWEYADGASIKYIAGQPPTMVNTRSLIRDDGGTLTQATVQITDHYQIDQDILLFAHAHGITGSWDAAAGRLTLDGAATLTDYQRAVQSVKYQNCSANPVPGDRTIIINTYDGAAWSDDASSTVTVMSAGADLWRPTGALATWRNGHTATRLPSGMVLVTGGPLNDGDTPCERYDPDTGTWSATGPSIESRRDGHTATLLHTGKVLVTGGTVVRFEDGSYYYDTTANGEIYDPGTGIWSAIPPMSEGRTYHTATLLDSGKVLVAGGYDRVMRSISTSELYDPATNTWSVTGSLGWARSNHTATLLQNGDVLVTGGFDEGEYAFAETCERYDPNTGVWTNTGSLSQAKRIGNSATMLASGRVLVVGGSSEYYINNILASCELYDPAAGTWSAVGDMIKGQAFHVATLLPSGKVLVAGGNSPYHSPDLPRCEWFDPTANAWSATRSLVTGRNYATFTSLVSGTVLAVGGSTELCELYDPGTAVFMSQPANQAVMVGAAATFAVVVDGPGPLACQWSRSDDGGITWVALDGATDVAYDVAATVIGDDGSAFCCAVTNAAGTVISDVAVLTLESAPVLAGIEATALTYVESQDAIAVTSTLTVSDQGHDTLTEATVQITESYQDGQDILSFADANGITGTWYPSMGMLTLSGIASTEAYQAALRAVQYRNAGDAPSSLVRTVTFMVHDGSCWSMGVSRAVTVTAVDTVPTVATAAVADPNPVTGAITALSVLGADDGGEAALTYTWTTTGTPPAAVAFSANGTHAAKESVATFTQPGSYALRATMTDPGGQCASSDVTVMVYAAPDITRQPVDQTVMAGQTAIFTVEAAGFPTPTYQWLLNGTAIAGATAAAYTIPAAACADDGGTYCCLVSNPANAVCSAVATLRVTSSGLIAHWRCDAGSGATLVDDVGTNHGVITGATWSSGQVDGALSFDGVAGAVGIATPSLAITSQVSVALWAFGGADLPKATCVLLATDASGTRVLNVHLPWRNGIVYWDAGNSGTSSYDRLSRVAAVTEYRGQWNHWVFTKDVAAGTMAIYLNGGLWTSATGRNRTIPAIVSLTLGGDPNCYAGRLDDIRIYNTALDAAAVLDLYNSYPIITCHPVSVAVTAGQSATFMVVATGVPAPIFQWRRNGEPIAGATGASYTTPAASLDDTGTIFTCVAGNGTGNTLSSAATLTVNDAGNAAPTVVSAAAADPGPVTGTTVALSVLGADDAGEAGLTYTWSTTGTPPAAAGFSVNGTNAAKATTARFAQAGGYSLLCTISDAGNLATTSEVTVTVDQAATSVAVTPATVSVGLNGTQQFTATVHDQFGIPLTDQPAIIWSPDSVTSGTLNAAGLFTANAAAGGPFTLTATGGGRSGRAMVTVVNAAPTVVEAAQATPRQVTDGSTVLTALGADDGGEANLIYTWSTLGAPPAPVVFSSNGTNADRSVMVQFAHAGAYTLQVLIRDQGGLTATSSVKVAVDHSHADEATIVTIAGNGMTGVAQEGDLATSSPIAEELGIIWARARLMGMDAQENVYFWNYGVKRVNKSTGLIERIAGNGQIDDAYPGDGGIARDSAVTPDMSASWVQPNGDVFFTWGNPMRRLVQVRASDNAMVTYATYDPPMPSTSNMVMDRAGGVHWAVPITDMPEGISGIALNPAEDAMLIGYDLPDFTGYIYCYPMYANLSSALIAGNGQYGFSGDGGPALDAAISGVFGLSMDEFGNIYFGDWNNIRIRRIGAVDHVISTVAGDGGFGFNGDGLAATATTLGSVDRTIIDASGNIVFNDVYNGRIRKVVFNGVLTPSGPTVAVAAAAAPNPLLGVMTTALSVLGADRAGEGGLTYTWSTPDPPPAPVTFSANGTNDAKLTTATFTTEGTYVLRATIANGKNQMVASDVTVVVRPMPVSISVNPSSIQIYAGQTYAFTATGTDASGRIFDVTNGVSWTASAGTISSGGVLTAGQGQVGICMITASVPGVPGMTSESFATVNVPMVITGSADFTGYQTGSPDDAVDGVRVCYTNNGWVTVIASAVVSSGAIEQITVQLGDELVTITGGSGVASFATSAEGSYDLHVTAAASDGISALSREINPPMRMMVDRTAPKVRLLLPRQYWPAPECIPRGTKELPMLLRASNQVWFNGMDHEWNDMLRGKLRLPMFGPENDYRVVVAVDDDTGLDGSASTAEVKDKDGDSSGLSTPLSLQVFERYSGGDADAPDENASSRQRLVITGFSMMDESFPKGVEEGDGQYVPGRYRFNMELKDRAGNVASLSSLLMITYDTVPPDLQDPDNYYEWNDLPWPLGGVSYSSVFRYFNRGSMDESLGFVWQGSEATTENLLQFDGGSGNSHFENVHDNIGFFGEVFDGFRLNTQIVGAPVGDHIDVDVPEIKTRADNEAFIVADEAGNRYGDGAAMFSFISCNSDIRYGATGLFDGKTKTPDSICVVNWWNVPYANACDADITLYNSPKAFAIYNYDDHIEVDKHEVCSVNEYEEFVGQLFDEQYVYDVGYGIVVPLDPDKSENEKYFGPGVVTILPTWKTRVTSADLVILAVSDGLWTGSAMGRMRIGCVIDDELTDAIVVGCGLQRSFVPLRDQMLPGFGDLEYEYRSERVDPYASIDVADYAASDDGLTAGVSLTSADMNTDYWNHTNNYWVNAIRATPDIAAAGQSVTVTIEAGFLNRDFTLKDFDSRGNYVRFLNGENDLTISPEQWVSGGYGPDQLASKIAIMEQRLVPCLAEGSPEAFWRCQELQLDLLVGADVEAGLCNIDVYLGAVHAYTDELSQQYKGTGGDGQSHRMKEALAIIKKTPKAYASSGGLVDLESGKLPLSAPHPVIKMTNANFSTSSSTPGSDTALPKISGAFSLSGTLSSGMCDITEGDRGTIDSVDVYLDGATDPLATIPVQVTKGSGQAPRKYPYSGTFQGSVQVSLGLGPHTFSVRAKDKVIGKVGSAELVIECRAKPHQEPTPTKTTPAGFPTIEHPLVAEINLSAVEFGALLSGGSTLGMTATSLIANGPSAISGQLKYQPKGIRGLTLSCDGLQFIVVEADLRAAINGTVDVFAATIECPSITSKVQSVVFRRADGARFVTDYYVVTITGAGAINNDGPIEAEIRRGANGPVVTKVLNNNGNIWSSSDGQLSMNLSPNPVINGQPIGVTATFNSDFLGVVGEIAQIQGAQSGNIALSTEALTYGSDTGSGDGGEDGGTDDNFEIYANYPELITQDDTEDFTVLAVEVEGPPEIIEKDDFRIDTYSGKRKIVKKDGKHYLANAAGTERETLVLLRPQESSVINGQFIGELAELPFQSAKFLAGFGVGFSGGAVEMVSDTGSLIGKAFETGGLLILTWWPGEYGQIAAEEAEKRITAGYEISSDIVSAVSGIVKDIGARHDEIIEAIMMGDREQLKGIGEEYAAIFEMGFDVVSEATDVFFDDMSSYDQGKLFGRVIFEIASFVRLLLGFSENYKPAAGDLDLQRIG